MHAEIKTLIDQYAAGCEFDDWHDTLLVDWLHVHDSILEKVGHADLPNLAIARGFWQDTDTDHLFIATKAQILFQSDETVLTILLKECQDYLYSLELKAKGH